MKKTFFLFIVLLSLSFSSTAFADDGNSHSGGKNCNPGPTCGNFSAQTGSENDEAIYQSVVDFLHLLFK